ncbi:MAG: sulfite exporter TauE/SafE family protein [Burkholderiales bacterium]
MNDLFSWWWVAYPVMGLFAGFFAGLLGIGGGLILVSLMVFAFNAQHFPPDRVMHLALGTSLATIIFTSIKSVHSHHKHGAVRWDIVRHAAFGLVVGTLAGSVVADALRTRALAIVFTAFVVYSAINMMLDLKPKPTRQLPGPMGLQFGAGIVGVASALVGAGGGFLSIPLMSFCNVPMRQCVATSAAFGLPIAVSGTLGFLVGGWNQDHLPPLSLGYLYVPAMVGIVAGTFVTVPIGAKVAHTIPVPKLKKVFAVILSIMAIKMTVSLF